MPLYRLLANFGISAGSFERIGLGKDGEVHAESAKKKKSRGERKGTYFVKSLCELCKIFLFSA